MIFLIPMMMSTSHLFSNHCQNNSIQVLSSCSPQILGNLQVHPHQNLPLKSCHAKSPHLQPSNIQQILLSIPPSKGNHPDFHLKHGKQFLNFSHLVDLFYRMQQSKTHYNLSTCQNSHQLNLKTHSNQALCLICFT